MRLTLKHKLRDNEASKFNKTDICLSHSHVIIKTGKVDPHAEGGARILNKESDRDVLSLQKNSTDNCFVKSKEATKISGLIFLDIKVPTRRTWSQSLAQMVGLNNIFSRLTK